MQQIILTRGKVSLVDDEDFELVSNYLWHAHKDNKNGVYYAEYDLHPGKLYIHQLVMNVYPPYQIDHKNHDGLDNQKYNLRVCTGTQNQANSRKRKRTSSIYKGVCWKVLHNKWQAYIQANYKWQHLGYFESEIEAAQAYDNAAIEYFGEFANLNLKVAA